MYCCELYVIIYVHTKIYNNNMLLFKHVRLGRYSFNV